MGKWIDLYTYYLLNTLEQVMITRLSSLLDGSFSYDKTTCQLPGKGFVLNDLW